jgi:pimeloyl-ACP methyl ester carboxylesterase
MGESALQIQECVAMYGLHGERYLCGFLNVPENYSVRDGTLIRVPFLVILPQQTAQDTSLTPLLVTGGGGPGNALLGNEFSQPLDSSFHTYEAFSVADDRPLILLENRGVGRSEPNLDCRYSMQHYSKRYWSELLSADVQCGSAQIANGIDLSQYQVHNAALDIEVFRQLMAAHRINNRRLNLYGVSYGARVAMYYERLFPSSTRTLLLDSASVNTADAAAKTLNYGQQSLDNVFRKCRSLPGCRRRFGVSLETEFYRFLSEVGTKDITLSLQRPGSNEAMSVPLTGTVVVDILHSALYSSDTIAAIPLMLRQMIDGDYNRLTDSLNDYLQTYGPTYSFSDTAFLTYHCFDRRYPTDPLNAPAEIKLYPYWGFDQGRQHIETVCKSYQIERGTDLLQQPYQSLTPALFLSGDLDPVTPPTSVAQATAAYEYHWHIVEKNVSHDVVSHSQCAQYLASWFIYHPREDLEARRAACAPTRKLHFLTR